jgi:hypothetical protein
VQEHVSQGVGDIHTSKRGNLLSFISFTIIISMIQHINRYLFCKILSSKDLNPSADGNRDKNMGQSCVVTNGRYV